MSDTSRPPIRIVNETGHPKATDVFLGEEKLLNVARIAFDMDSNRDKLSPELIRVTVDYYVGIVYSGVGDALPFLHLTGPQGEARDVACSEIWKLIETYAKGTGWEVNRAGDELMRIFRIENPADLPF